MKDFDELKMAVLKWVENPSLSEFFYLQNEVFENPLYEPYSDDHHKVTEYYVEEEYDKLLSHENVNTLLCPLAYSLKVDACMNLDKFRQGTEAKKLYNAIMASLLESGDGSEANPYIITRLSDEFDILQHLDEDQESQFLLQIGDRRIDKIRCHSGRELHFDVTKILESLGFDEGMDWE